ncbi:Berberine/berberine-like protein [Metarhizium rileyi]|uniref:Berberine/berberine-like protein n=1 Tax=Metarhizium rileyi (strain RCEF 4871) TaxID=1649241 RepID=A0A166X8Z7_METRR|nr:Berberine/berberine-like protein [Metarhizium rileyi RCEF 4871]
MNAFMTTMNSFYNRDWPNEMAIESSWLCDLEKTKSDLRVRFLFYYNGDRTAFNQIVDAWTLPSALRQHAELKYQLKRRSLQEPSSRFLHETLAAQWVEETKKALPTTRVYQIYTSFVFQNDIKDMREITRIVRKQMLEFRRQFSNETGMMQWDEKWLEEPMRRFLGQIKPMLSVYGMVKWATFTNFPDDALKPEVHEQAYYGKNRLKLREIKEAWDPDNF